jgi:hypothetical protein
MPRRSESGDQSFTAACGGHRACDFRACGNRLRGRAAGHASFSLHQVSLARQNGVDPLHPFLPHCFFHGYADALFLMCASSDGCPSFQTVSPIKLALLQPLLRENANVCLCLTTTWLASTERQRRALEAKGI